MTKPEGWGSVPLGELMTEDEVKSLIAYVRKWRGERYLRQTKHQLIMKWLGENKTVAQKAQYKGLLLDFFAYALEFVLMKDIP